MTPAAASCNPRVMVLTNLEEVKKMIFHNKYQSSRGYIFKKRWVWSIFLYKCDIYDPGTESILTLGKQLETPLLHTIQVCLR